jgi:hypothetical protein
MVMREEGCRWVGSVACEVRGASIMVVREEGCRWVGSVACEVRGSSWW